MSEEEVRREDGGMPMLESTIDARFIYADRSWFVMDKGPGFVVMANTPEEAIVAAHEITREVLKVKSGPYKTHQILDEKGIFIDPHAPKSAT